MTNSFSHGCADMGLMLIVSMNVSEADRTQWTSALWWVFD